MPRARFRHLRVPPKQFSYSEGRSASASGPSAVLRYLPLCSLVRAVLLCADIGETHDERRQMLSRGRVLEGGVIAGLVFAVFEVTAAVVFSGPAQAFLPLRMIGAMVLGPHALDPKLFARGRCWRRPAAPRDPVDDFRRDLRSHSGNVPHALGSGIGHVLRPDAVAVQLLPDRSGARMGLVRPADDSSRATDGAHGRLWGGSGWFSITRG